MKALAIATAALLLAPLAAATTTAHERNLDFLWSLIGPHDPATAAILHDGRTMTLAAAIDDAAARAGSFDLAALASGALWGDGPLPFVHPGDVWVLESGRGNCDEISTGVQQPIGYYGDAQFSLYRGWFAAMTTEHGTVSYIIGWSSKTVEIGYDTLGFTVAGDTDLYCIEYADSHLAFPFSDGIAYMNEETP